MKAWKTAVQLQLPTFHDGRLLVASIDTDSLMVIALETNAPKLEEDFDDAASLFNRVEVVLGKHAHTIVGRGETLSKAMLMAEEFSMQWKNGTPLAQCKCSEVLPP